MSSNKEFEIPLGFIQVKRKQLNLKDKIADLDDSSSSFDDIVNPELKYSNLKSKSKRAQNSQKKKVKRRVKLKKQQFLQDSGQSYQEVKRQIKVKSLLRKQNLKQKSILDFMHKKQAQLNYKTKAKIKERLYKSGIYCNVNPMRCSFVDLEQEKNPSKIPKITYVNYKQMNGGENILEQDQQARQKGTNQGQNKIGFNNSYQNKKIMFQLNKPLHQKNTYRFNVEWWQDEMRKPKPVYSQGKDEVFDEKIRKNLKRNLKPLRIHRLIGSKYAPLCEFMMKGIHEKDGIRNGRNIDSSQSQDQLQRLQGYDRDITNQAQLSQNENIILLDVSQVNENEGFEVRQRTEAISSQPVIQNRLKRAIKKMKQHKWKQDKLYTHGCQQQMAIAIEELSQ